MYFCTACVFLLICCANSLKPAALTVTPEANIGYNKPTWQSLPAPPTLQALTRPWLLHCAKRSAQAVNLYKPIRRERSGVNVWWKEMASKWWDVTTMSVSLLWVTRCLFPWITIYNVFFPIPLEERSCFSHIPFTLRNQTHTHGFFSHGREHSLKVKLKPLHCWDEIVDIVEVEGKMWKLNNENATLVLNTAHRNRISVW